MRVYNMFPRILNALGALEEVTRLYHGAKNSAERILPALDAYPAIASGPVRVTRSRVRARWYFENVSFGYDPKVNVLENVSFQLATW